MKFQAFFKLTASIALVFPLWSHADLLQPEAASAITPKSGWVMHKLAVAAANPLAADAGYRTLQAGGSAVDAAIAVQMVLTLVEPQSSGLGGGAFLLHFNGREVEAFDGRETAPAAANEKLFLRADGTPMPFYDAVVGGRSVGVPGAVRMLELVHQQYGKLPWARLFEPAIALAEQGFAVSPRLHTLLTSDAYLRLDPVAAAYFYQANGQPHPVGHVLRNPELARTLRTIAQQGAAGLLQGEVAQAIVDKVRKHPSNPGQLSLQDLADYQAKKRTPLCWDYTAKANEYRICSMPPPSSGGVAVGQILSLLNQTPAISLPLENGLPSAQWLHWYTEAARLAFADRAAYVGDPDFIQAPGGTWSSLLNPAYLKQRAALIQPDQRMPGVQAGEPTGQPLAYAPMPEQAEYGTSHISIVDAAGHALSMTTTIESQFGARQMVKGFLLNNELTDFSFTPADAQGRLVVNRVEPGKRPRSSMAPTLVLDKATGQFVMSVGSPGGALIIHFVAKTLYGTLQWGLSPQQAIALPNFGIAEESILIEENTLPAATVENLQTRGHTVKASAMTSGLQAVRRVSGVYLGGADPRREGVVVGD